MLTSRGWWFLVVVFALLANAVLGPGLIRHLFPSAQVYFFHPTTLLLMPLALLLWFLWEWLWLSVRARLWVHRLRASRELWDEHGPVTSLWAGRTFEARVRVTVDGRAQFPYLVLNDRLPFGMKRSGGTTRFEGSLEAEHPAEWAYTLRCPAAGRVRFEGLSLQMSDLQGFFYATTFVPLPAVVPVLPSLVDAEGHAVGLKRHNLLLPPGVHRFRRPGSGSELLDLRDYVPGDPPKTIAWKISARRDRLITKEFESEVPIRCTLFLDTSDSVRLGPAGQNALTRLVDIAGGVAQSATDNRDLTGICCFDERGSRQVRPARGARHLVRLLNILADAAGLAPAPAAIDLNTVLPLGYAFGQEVYPELMSPSINRFPFWLAWLWPPPRYTVQRPTIVDFFYRWLPYMVPVYAVIGLILLGVIFYEILTLPESLLGDPRFAFIIVAPVLFASLMAFARLPGHIFFPEKRRTYRWRKQLAALLAARYGLAPGGLAILLEDDELFGHYLQRLLIDHHVPYPLSLYDDSGQYRFASAGKVKALAAALLRAVGKGHDNELFVLLVDLLELTNELDPLLRAVKVALARHHRVLLICPWPPGIAAPAGSSDDSRHAAAAKELGDEPSSDEIPTPDEKLEALLLRSTTERFHAAYQQLRRTCGRIGVPVVCAANGDPVRLILERIESLRDLRRK